MLAVTLSPLNNIQVPGGKSVLVPLTGVDSNNEPISYSFTSSNPSVTLSRVSQASKSLVLNVTGTDSSQAPFSGTLVLHLFEDLAPNTTARIEQLVTSGFYNSLPFTRVLDGFVAQGGDNGSGGSGQLLTDEINSSLTFDSRGLLALANRGRDTADSQFFITAIDAKAATTPITLADMPQFLDFRYTIFGQLVSGFDTFEKLMTTPVQLNSSTNENSQPVHAITITSASIITDTQNAVLRVSAPASFDGSSATITVTATNTDNQTSQQTFTAAAVTDSQTDPPFLGAVANQTTTAGSPVTFSLTSTDISGGGVAYKVVDPTTFAAPTNVTVSINQATGAVTLTPAANFTGTINLLAAVRASSAADMQTNYDTQAFALTVSASTNAPAAPTGLAVAPTSNTGAFEGGGYISKDGPKLTVSAVSGSTVQIKLNGAMIATATETATGSGVYTATIPAGKLAVGANAITAAVSNSNGTSADSTALSIVLAPDDTTGVYAVPGGPTTSQQLLVTMNARNAAYHDEMGFFVADSADGSIGGVAPGAAGYAKAALSSSTRQVIFAKGQNAGAAKTLTLQGGQFVVFYMIQNNTTDQFLAKNAADALHGNNNGKAPLAFFSVQAANPDARRHAQIVADATTGRAEFNWEDLLSLGDSDFNDIVMSVALASQSATPSATLHAPGTGSTTVNLNATLGSGTHQSAAPGDVGVFFVDDPTGKIGTLTPGSAGYAAAALTTAKSRVLLSSGATAGATGKVAVPAGKYLAFYAISNGTTSSLLSSNPTNASTGGAVSLFSFDAANPSSGNRFRWFTPGQQATNPSQMQLHIVDQVFGNESDYDDLAVALAFSA